MNILFLSINVPASASRDRIVYNFIEKEMRLLSERGHNVYFLAESIGEDREINGVKYLSIRKWLEKNTIIRRLKNLLFALRHVRQFYKCLLINPVTTINICGRERALDKIITSKNIQILHTHFFSPHGENGIVVAKKHNLPVLATLRGAELYNRPDLSYGAMRDTLFRIMIRRSVKKVDYFTVPNKFLLKELIRIFNIDPSKAEYLPNGVELIKKKNELKIESDVLKLIAIGRLTKRKNHLLLIETAEILRDEAIDLVIIGEGPEMGQLQKAIEHKKLENVKIIKEMRKTKLLGLFTNCDLLVHPSFIEGMPNVVLESLALGIPCLVSDISGHREIIRDNYNGYLFDPNSKSDLCSKIRKVLEDKPILKEMRDNCLESARRFRLENKIDRYLEIYKRLTNDNLVT